MKTGTSNSHAADPVQLRLVPFYNGNFVLHAAFKVIYSLTEISCGNSISCTAKRTIDTVHEMELPQWISVNAINDLESRMQNECRV